MATMGRDLPDDILNDADQRRQEPRRPKSEIEETGERDTDHSLTFDLEHELPGSVFMVPNRLWGIASLSSNDHPGVCAHYQAKKYDAIMVKGTDEENVRTHRLGYFFVSPTDSNGLKKTTAFELVPR